MRILANPVLKFSPNTCLGTFNEDEKELTIFVLPVVLRLGIIFLFRSGSYLDSKICK